MCWRGRWGREESVQLRLRGRLPTVGNGRQAFSRCSFYLACYPSETGRKDVSSLETEYIFSFFMGLIDLRHRG